VPNDTPPETVIPRLFQAALTDEVNQRISQAGLQGVMVYQSSDRHWTAERAWEQESSEQVLILHRTPASLFTGLKTDPEWLHQQTIRFLAWLERSSDRPPAVQTQLQQSLCIRDVRLSQNCGCLFPQSRRLGSWV